MTTRSSLARASVLCASGLSRHLGLGSGSTVGGRLGLAIDPALLAELARGRTIALVTGTNGKTTTTRLLAEALGGPGAVATSGAGANMPAGLVAALAAAPPGQPGVLEVDEGYLGAVARLVQPRVVLVLNLSRDQLDRVGEVRMTAARWRESFATLGATVVANCDDPLVAWAAGEARDVVWVAAGGLWRSDSYHCPACDARIDFPGAADPANLADLADPADPADGADPGLGGVPGGAGWSCRCGIRRPEPAARLEAGRLVLADRSIPIELSLPGRFNLANAAMAAVAASVLGTDAVPALAAMAGVVEVAGRFATGHVGEVSVRLLLAKNPAGWGELIELLAPAVGPVVVAINARDADGHDPSWLWDVPFERLAHRRVVATGERRHDLAVRLRHAGVEHLVADDQLSAVSAAGAPAVDYIGNYTAFQELRRLLARPGRHAGPRSRPVAGRVHPGPPVDPVVVPVLAPSVRPGADGEAAGPPGMPGPRRGESRTRSSHATALTVVVVHPDLLGTYGDAGNGAVLADRAAWRGLPVEIVLATSDRPLPRSGDIYCLGGGEDGPQSHSAARLSDGSLAAAVASGARVLAVCAGFQIVGSSFPGAGGRRQAGLGLLDVETARGTGPRAVGEILVEASGRSAGLAAGYRLSGFENHAGVTRLGPSASALGTVIRGTGNGVAPGPAGDGATVGAVEGAVGVGVIGTYLHGPVLARNPAFADLILAAAVGSALSPIDDVEEEMLRAERLRFAMGASAKAHARSGG
jgi:CobQ-like glutamine amidotransferase family enzyme